MKCLFKKMYSSAIDGISGNRRRDGIQGAVAETHEKQSIVVAEAAQNLPLSKRQRECGRTVENSLINEPHMLRADKRNHTSSFSLKGQASDAKHPRIDREREAAFQVGSFSCAVSRSVT